MCSPLMERIFGIFGKAWVLCNIRSFDSWGGCRTPNFSSSISCLHVYMAWLRGLVLSVHGRVDVSAVRRGCKISWCTTSPSGHATIVIKFTYALLWRSGHSSCSRVFPYTYTHQYPNGLKRDSTWPTLPRITTGCVLNDIGAYGKLGANRAPILH